MTASKPDLIQLSASISANSSSASALTNSSPQAVSATLRVKVSEQ